MEVVEWASLSRKKYQRPFPPVSIECVSAGFPSPAEDYLDLGIDLNEHLIENPISTFFLKVSGHSMNEAGIQDGDLLIIDRSIDPQPGQVVIAIMDGEFTVKRLRLHENNLYLEAENPDYPSLDLRNYNDVQIWGVAIYSIHSLGISSKPAWLKRLR